MQEPLGESLAGSVKAELALLNNGSCGIMVSNRSFEACKKDAAASPRFIVSPAASHCGTILFVIGRLLRQAGRKQVI